MRWKIIGGLQTVFGTRKMLVTKSLCYDEENGKQEGMEFFVQLHGPTSNLELDLFLFFFQAEDGIRDLTVTGDQTCALPISGSRPTTPTSRTRAFRTPTLARPTRRPTPTPATRERRSVRGCSRAFRNTPSTSSACTRKARYPPGSPTIGDPNIWSPRSTAASICQSGRKRRASSTGRSASVSTSSLS